MYYICKAIEKSLFPFNLQPNHKASDQPSEELEASDQQSKLLNANGHRSCNADHDEQPHHESHATGPLPKQRK